MSQDRETQIWIAAPASPAPSTLPPRGVDSPSLRSFIKRARTRGWPARKRRSTPAHNSSQIPAIPPAQKCGAKRSNCSSGNIFAGDNTMQPVIPLAYHAKQSPGRPVLSPSDRRVRATTADTRSVPRDRSHAERESRRCPTVCHRRSADLASPAYPAAPPTQLPSPC